jgi:cation transport ATPase
MLHAVSAPTAVPAEPALLPAALGVLLIAALCVGLGLLLQWLVSGGGKEEKPPTRLRTVLFVVPPIGSTILLEPGDTVPADAEVIEGAAVIDESVVNGISSEVLCETGGSCTRLLGGSSVVSGRVVARIVTGGVRPCG